MDVAASVRRFSLGIQTRGLHVQMRQARTKEEHLAFAQQLEHPNTAVGRALEPELFYAFSQLAAGFHTSGVTNTSISLVDYRHRVMEWIYALKQQVQPLQRELNRHITTHAGHVQSVLLCALLVIVEYPNPELAWRFFHGAPVVGEFFAAALRDRTRVNGRFDDPTIRKVARDCERSLASVTTSVTPKAAEKAMKKTRGEFDSGTLRGPFDSPEQMRIKMQ